MKLYPERIANSLAVTFPELGEFDEVTTLGDGFRALVVETPHGEVFKIAKNWEGAAGLNKEVRLLPLVRGRLPVAVPHPVWMDGPSRHFPFGVLGYPGLDGVALTPLLLTNVDQSTLACDVANLLVELHGLQITEELGECLPTPRAHWNELGRLRNTLAPALRELFSPAEYRVISGWWDSFLADAHMHIYTPLFQHGDFWHENLLLDERSGRLSGLVDFENAALGDPAQDFATLLHLGRSFTNAVMREYEAAGGILDEGLLYRTQRLWELREFVGIGFAIRTTNQKEFDDALVKLRNGPLLNDTTRRETALWPPRQH